MKPVLPQEGTMYLHMRDGSRIDTTKLRDSFQVAHEVRAKKKQFNLRETCGDCGLDSTRPWMYTAMDIPKEDLERKYTKENCPECTRGAAVAKYKTEMEQRQKEAEAMKDVAKRTPDAAPPQLQECYKGPGLASMVTTEEFLNGQRTKSKRATAFQASARVARRGTGRLRMTK